MTLASFIDDSVRDKENWRYTDLRALLAARATCPAHAPHDVVKATEPGKDRARLVFVNGVWQPKLSHFGAVPSCILLGDLESGYKLTLGEQTCLVAQPIELVFTADAEAPAEIDLKLSIEIGNNGRLTLLETHAASNAITTMETDILLRPRAKFLHGKIVQGGGYLASTKAVIASGGYYNNFTLLRGGEPARNQIDVRMTGPEAQAMLNGAMLLRGHEHADTTTTILHQAPQCASRQVYKTVLNDKARGVFQGKVIVAPDAQKSDGYQLSRALLLSDQAEMDAKPALEIYADDVKCSHGCSVGDLDEEALFYLRSRGLSETEARALLIEAFVGELFDQIPVEEWRDVFRRECEGWSK